MSLKAKIRNLAKSKNISAQAVLQNYLMHRFLFRLSKSEYSEKFVVKGGMLISSIVGVDQRSTMDLDTTLRNLSMTEDAIKTAFMKICIVEADDGIKFVFDSVGPIRDDDEYGGYKIMFHAVFGKINVPMSMDISTGDIITPEASKHVFRDMFEPESTFELWSYNIETVLAEKVETILSRSIENTRPRDFYDVYMLSAYDYDAEIFVKAFEATSKHRGSFQKIEDVERILDMISTDTIMQKRWEDYTHQMAYASGIEFRETINAVKALFSCCL
ncbi:MAG: nucleotidyl transferase AbiEii/AbiGii toxin family protein [Lachnospiraceae bacterium]|nr:nucleotidyl transferase AbiEii/AbiGii toxin family protein [Lachnospiraceae bacterium]